MPEGPEIRRVADRLGRALAGKRAETVWFAFDDLAAAGKRLSGRVVESVEPRGKALLTRFEGGWNVYSHNQLYGRWYVMVSGRRPKTGRSLRLHVATETHDALLYSASDIEVLRDRELADHPFLSRIGPDVLDANTTVDDVTARLLDKRFARRSLGALLLDQGFVSGLGNYLRSEILFVARLDPSQRPADLHANQIEDLAHATLRMTRRAYRQRGVTNDPDAVRQLKAEGQRRSQYRHFVFGRAGQSCRVCGETIERREVGARRLYLCAACQAR